MVCPIDYQHLVGCRAEAKVWLIIDEFLVDYLPHMTNLFGCPADTKF